MTASLSLVECLYQESSLADHCRKRFCCSRVLIFDNSQAAVPRGLDDASRILDDKPRLGGQLWRVERRLHNGRDAPSYKEKTTDNVNDLTQVESCKVGETIATHAGTNRRIKSRHAQMIAIGGSIGTGLFVGSGQALAMGGPGFLLVAYCLTSLLVYGVVTAVIEVGAYLPVEGASMAYYCGRYVSKSLGFALGWLYFYSFGINAYEITAASIVINYWPNDVPVAVWITIMLVIIVALNLSPVAIYAETEFWFAGIKVIMLIGLLILSIVLMLGGGPNHDRIEFTSFLYVWVFAGFSFYFGPELMIFMTGEMYNPRKNLPTAARRFFYRLIFFYVLGAIAIGAICNSNAKSLTSGQGNANASPWVIAIQNAGISVLPSVVNAGILTSAWSAGNSYLFMSSRALFSLAVAGDAPRIFARCTKYGLPIYAVAASSCFCLLAYLNVSSQAGEVFNWFISLTNTAGYTSWAVCCVIFLRFRKGCQAQGVEVAYSSRFQPYAAWICLPTFVFLLLCNGFTVFYPGRFTASSFLTTYLGIPVFLLLWIGHKLLFNRKEKWMYAPTELDLHTGLREVEDSEEMQVNEEIDNGGKPGNKAIKAVKAIWE
ncbi:hypothetical protein M409DRAFT_66505 [Zasmidium cellare ATCC 36951]|uniref:Amino acid permease/ SLC12A domain-containing protein n=1 Tax=Zasmidium cellare ATCC 36951 TaxID=1080233 RepID=A0A6A6CJU6_ZASCE|nr:uncharacterized protein M409DRAFT_66505 [Zasmidium cellare ATCC 36951]KAF2166420.1 hypothetical protein M409DRAFT_66505 [Zasmidium cellare ATCC 36951]